MATLVRGYKATRLHGAGAAVSGWGRCRIEQETIWTRALRQGGRKTKVKRNAVAKNKTKTLGIARYASVMYGVQSGAGTGAVQSGRIRETAPTIWLSKGSEHLSGY